MCLFIYYHFSSVFVIVSSELALTSCHISRVGISYVHEVGVENGEPCHSNLFNSDCLSYCPEYSHSYSVNTIEHILFQVLSMELSLH